MLKMSDGFGFTQGPLQVSYAALCLFGQRKATNLPDIQWLAVIWQLPASSLTGSLVVMVG